jgi:hypothetical protein
LVDRRDCARSYGATRALAVAQAIVAVARARSRPLPQRISSRLPEMSRSPDVLTTPDRGQVLHCRIAADAGCPA